MKRALVLLLLSTLASSFLCSVNALGYPIFAGANNSVVVSNAAGDLELSANAGGSIIARSPLSASSLDLNSTHLSAEYFSALENTVAALQANISSARDSLDTLNSLVSSLSDKVSLLNAQQVLL